MSRRSRGLLSEIERDAMSEDRSLASTLRKCVILGGHAGSTDLREWATRELRGYEPEDELPKYRIIPAPIRVDAIRGNYKITGQRISPGELPDVVAELIDEEVQIRLAFARSKRSPSDMKRLTSRPVFHFQVEPTSSV